MIKYTIKGVEFITNGEFDIPQEEATEYIERGLEKYGDRLMRVIAFVDPEDTEMVDLEYCYKENPFHRLRRITGYLVGTLDRWNNGKRAEERDRVKHSAKEE